MCHTVYDAHRRQSVIDRGVLTGGPGGITAPMFLNFQESLSKSRHAARDLARALSVTSSS